MVMACKDAKARRIIGIDINPAKFTVAMKLGCTEVLNPNDLGNRQNENKLLNSIHP